ncbi:MAG TPA: ketopantoate reductase family protein [Chloroflexi bacterium]|nr:ketopantoate reductase family protein [Chloroflexota bacterium]
MRCLIVGVGAIGSLVGSKLAEAGHEVTLVGRPGYVNAVRTHGVGWEEEGERDYVTGVKAVTHVAHSGLLAQEPFDLIVFTMKAYDTPEAASQVAPLIERGIPLLLLQNGVGGEESVRDVLDRVDLYSAVITLPVEVVEPGVIRLTKSRGGLGVAPTEAGQSVRNLVRAFRKAGFDVAACDDYRAMKWSKLLLNMLGNASPAILDMPPDQVFAHPGLFNLERAAFQEAVKVMQALGLRPVALPGYPVPLLAWGICNLPECLLRPIFQRIIVAGRGGKMPSLYIDLVRRKARSEVEFLNGAVVKYAREAGVAVPANEALYAVLIGIVRDEKAWDDYRGQPERLLEAVAANCQRARLC